METEHITIESSHPQAETIIGLCLGAVFVGILLSVASFITNGLLGGELHLTLASIWVMVALACALILFHSFQAKLREWQPEKPKQELTQVNSIEVATQALADFAWWWKWVIEKNDYSQKTWLPVGHKFTLPQLATEFDRAWWDRFYVTALNAGLIDLLKAQATQAEPSSPKQPSRKSRKPVSETSSAG